jgi:hypothetical protein
MKHYQNKVSGRAGQRPLLFACGLVIAFGLVLSAFEYRTGSNLLTSGIPGKEIKFEPLINDTLFVLKPEKDSRIRAGNPNAFSDVFKIKDMTDIFDEPDDDFLKDLPFGSDEGDSGMVEYFPPGNYNQDSVEEINNWAEIYPAFKGCEVFTDELDRRTCTENKIHDFLKSNLNTGDLDAEGIVYASFVVDKNGFVKDAGILRGLGKRVDEKVIATLKQLPRFKPAEQGLRTVPIRYDMKINFTVSDK